MSLIKQYRNEKPIGLYPLLAFAGIAVFDPKDNDCDFVTAFYANNEYSGFRKINVDEDNSFSRYGKKISLDEIIKSDPLNHEKKRVHKQEVYQEYIRIADKLNKLSIDSKC